MQSSTPCWERTHPLFWTLVYSLVSPIGFTKIAWEFYRESLQQYRARHLGARSGEAFAIDMVINTVFWMFTAGLTGASLIASGVAVVFDWQRESVVSLAMPIYAMFTLALAITLYMVFSGKLQRIMRPSC